MARLCERPACSERGAVAYGFDAGQLVVWLAAFDPEVDRPRAGVLCRRHADSMIVPRGWTLDDRRDRQPPLFKAPRTPRRTRPPRRKTPAAPRSKAQSTADELPLASDEANTVAELSGSQPDDPDATVAMPWMPVFDITDDLGGVLRAESPLLARAFQGETRRR